MAGHSILGFDEDERFVEPGTLSLGPPNPEQSGQLGLNFESATGAGATVTPGSRSLAPNPQRRELTGRQKFGNILLNAGLAGKGVDPRAASRSNAIEQFNFATGRADKALAVLPFQDLQSGVPSLVENFNARVTDTGRDLNESSPGVGDVFMLAARNRVRRVGGLLEVIGDSPTAEGVVLAGGVEGLLDLSEEQGEAIGFEVALNQSRRLLPQVRKDLARLVDNLDPEFVDSLRGANGKLTENDIPVMSERAATSNDPEENFAIPPEKMMDTINTVRLLGDEVGNPWSMGSDAVAARKEQIKKGVGLYRLPDGRLATALPGSPKEAELLALGAVPEKPGTVVAADPKVFLPDTDIRKSMAGLRDLAVTVDDGFRVAQRMMDTIAANPDANTYLGGALPSLINALRVEVDSAISLVTGKENVFVLHDENGVAREVGSDEFFRTMAARAQESGAFRSFLDQMGGTANARAAVLGDLVTLSYVRAKINDKTGRVSDNDYKAAERSLGADSDVAIFGSRLAQFQSDMVESFDQRMFALNSDMKIAAKGKSVRTFERKDFFRNEDIVNFTSISEARELDQPNANPNLIWNFNTREQFFEIPPADWFPVTAPLLEMINNFMAKEGAVLTTLRRNQLMWMEEYMRENFPEELEPAS